MIVRFVLVMVMIVLMMMIVTVLIAFFELTVHEVDQLIRIQTGLFAGLRVLNRNSAVFRFVFADQQREFGMGAVCRP